MSAVMALVFTCLGFVLGGWFASEVYVRIKRNKPPLSQPSLNRCGNPPVGGGVNLVEGKTLEDALRKHAKMLEEKNSELEKECSKLKDELRRNRYADLVMLLNKISFDLYIGDNTLIDDKHRVVIEESKVFKVYGDEKLQSTMREYCINEDYLLNTQDRELLNEAVTDFRDELQHYLSRDS